MRGVSKGGRHPDVHEDVKRSVKALARREIGGDAHLDASPQVIAGLSGCLPTTSSTVCFATTATSPMNATRRDTALIGDPYGRDTALTGNLPRFAGCCQHRRASA